MPMPFRALKKLSLEHSHPNDPDNPGISPEEIAERELDAAERDLERLREETD